MKMSTSIGALAKALSLAQGMMKGAEKDRNNTFFKSSYSTLDSVIEALREPFAKNGLSFSQPTSILADGAVVVETLLMHESGEWLLGEITGKPVKNDPQGVGSLVSYLKRYALQAITGMSSKEEDDDGNAAAMGKPQAVEKRQEPAHVKTTAKVTPLTIYDGETALLKAELFSIAKKLGIKNVDHLKSLNATCKGLEMEALESAVKEWMVDNKVTAVGIQSEIPEYL